MTLFYGSVSNSRNITPSVFENMPNSTSISPGLFNDTNNISSTEPPCLFSCTFTIAKKLNQIFSHPTDIIAIALCLVGICANGMSILAVSRLGSKTTHLKLIISLCVSDALILTGILLYYTLFILTSWQSCTKMILRLTTDLAILATLINLLVMAIDHYLAIIKPLHYKQKMTHFLGCCIVCGIWVACLFVVILEILINLSTWHDQNISFCRVIEYGKYNVELFIISFIFIVLFGIALIYGRIYIQVKKVLVMPRRIRANSYTDSGSTKALMTTMLFVATFIIFWAPKATYSVVLYIILKKDPEYVFDNQHSIILAEEILFVVLLLNSVADPIIYAIRLPKVKKGFVAMLTSSSKESASKRNKSSTHFRS